MAVSFKWLGHSAYSIDIDGHAVLIDPFLTGNPLAVSSPDDIDAEVILMTHVMSLLARNWQRLVI